MRLFRPIVRFFRHLKSYEKFSAIGIILGIPIIVLTLILISTLNNQINITDQRSLGASYNLELQQLYKNIQSYHYEFLSDEQSQQQLITSYNDIYTNIQKLFNYDDKKGNSTLVTDQIKELDKLWQLYHPNVGRIYSDRGNYLYDEIKTTLLNLIEIIAHEYELILPDDKFNYYLSRDVIMYLPHIVHYLDEIKVSCLREGESILPLEKRKAIYLTSTIKSNLEGLERSKLFMDLANIREQYRKNQSERTHHQNVIDELKAFVSTIESGIIETGNLTTTDILEKTTRLINMNFALYKVEVNQLEKMINSELKKLKIIRGLIITFQVIAFLLTVYCFYGFYLSVYYSLKEIDQERQLVKNKYTETQRQLKAVEKKMTQRVMEAHENERKSIVKDLHDTIGQSLYSMMVKLQVAKDYIVPEGKENLQEVIEISDIALKEIRRISQRLRPEILDDLGFIPALKSFISYYQKTYNIQVNFHYPEINERVDEETETQLYRICQEALTNVAKHAEATQVTLCIHKSQKHIHLKIKDNGKGFSVDHYIQTHARETLGLFSMKERAQSLNGTFKIKSTKNKGTTIKIKIPNHRVAETDE